MTNALATSIGSDFASQVLSGSLLAAVPIALLAGLVSFASPCVLPLVPGYLGYVSGMAGTGGSGGTGKQASRPKLILGVLLFIAGFSSVFVVLGIIVSAAGAQFQAQMDVIMRVMGVFVILMGLAFMGAMPFLQSTRKLNISPRAGLVGAPILGVAFGLGWSPCMGPTLSAVMTLGLNEGTVLRGALLAVVFCLGLGLPFLALAVWFERSGPILGWLRRHRRGLQLFGGAMLVILGVLLVTGLWVRLTGVLQGWIDGFWVSI